MDDNKYIPEEGEKNKFKIIKKIYISIYKNGKYHNNETKININDLKKFLLNDKEFALFLFDFLEKKSNIISISYLKRNE